MMRFPRAYRVGHAGFCAVVLAAGLGAAPAMAAPACYTSSVLQAVPGEERVRPHVPTGNVLTERALPAARSVPERLAGSIRRVDLPAGVKLVALTFDLCEASGEVSGYDGAIVDYLRGQEVHATFFAGGKWMMSHPARASQLIADPLFEVGSHSWSHANMSVVPKAAMERQVDDADMAFAIRRDGAQAAGCAVSGIPERAALFRFPYGSCSPTAMGYVNETGHLAIQWDVDSGDPAFLGARLMAEAMMRSIKPGSIILMHANGRGKHTAEALRLLVPALRAKGYRFATVSQLLSAGTPVIAATCYSEHPGDTRVYDEAARAGRRILPPQ